MTRTHYKLNHSDTPIRLFQSDFLEFFTHISPIAVLVIWLPVVGYFLYQAGRTASLGVILAGYGLGLFVWTLVEYLMHRFVFHFPTQGRPRLERIVFLFHGVHHAQPQLKTRLVMPPVVSIPLALAFYGLFSLVCKALGVSAWLYPLFSGAVSGYIAYDMIHYATHHFAMRAGVWKFLKRHHMAHHFKTENARFGVSSPLWDYVFHTMPAD